LTFGAARTHDGVPDAIDVVLRLAAHLKAHRFAVTSRKLGRARGLLSSGWNVW
jgi:hypothetical protein